MAELATIARPMPKPCSRLAVADLDGARQLARRAGRRGAATPQLRQFADNPKVPSEQVFDVSSGVRRSQLPRRRRRTSCAR